jgi:hypothetical protein
LTEQDIRDAALRPKTVEPVHRPPAVDDFRCRRNPAETKVAPEQASHAILLEQRGFFTLKCGTGSKTKAERKPKPPRKPGRRR